MIYGLELTLLREHFYFAQVGVKGFYFDLYSSLCF